MSGRAEVDSGQRASDAKGSRPGRGWIVLLVTSLLVSAATAPLLIDSAARRAGFEPGPNRLTVALRALSLLAGVEARRASGSTVEIVYAGDSTVVGYGWGRQLPRRLDATLRADLGAQTPVHVTSIGFPGMGIHAYALFADVIAQTRPDYFVWQIALTHTSTAWIAGNTRGELAGWTALDRLPALVTTQPMPGGLSVDRLLANQAWVRLAGPRRWASARDSISRVAGIPLQLSQRLHGGEQRDPISRHHRAARFARRVAQSPPDRLNRFDGETSRRQFDAALRGIAEDDPIVQALSGAVARIAGTGTRVIVYLTPLNHQHLREVDAYDEARFEQSIASLRGAVIDGGGAFIDLSEMLEDADFKDGVGHFVDGPARAWTDATDAAGHAARRSRGDGPDRIVRIVADAVEAELRRQHAQEEPAD